MSNGIDLGDIAGVVAGYKAGRISYDVARRALRSAGTGDSLIDEMLAIGVGVGAAVLLGGVVDSFVDGLFGDW